MGKLKDKKAFRVTATILKSLLFAFAAVVMVFTVISVTSFDRDSGSGLFGYKFFIVLSDSMKDTFAVGDVAISKTVDTSGLSEGDIITFKSIDPENYGEVVTHKIRSVTTYEGKKAFVTYGTTTGSSDAYPALEEKVIGQYSTKITSAGYVFQFLKSPAGYFTLIFIPFLILIIMEGIRFFGIVRKYKKEQQADIDRQKSELEAEKQKTLEMMDELKKLREQIGDRREDGETAEPSGKE